MEQKLIYIPFLILLVLEVCEIHGKLSSLRLLFLAPNKLSNFLFQDFATIKRFALFLDISVFSTETSKQYLNLANINLVTLDIYL